MCVEEGFTGREHFTDPRRPAKEGRPVGKARAKNRGAMDSFLFTSLLLVLVLF